MIYLPASSDYRMEVCSLAVTKCTARSENLLPDETDVGQLLPKRQCD